MVGAHTISGACGVHNGARGCMVARGAGTWCMVWGEVCGDGGVLEHTRICAGAGEGTHKGCMRARAHAHTHGHGRVRARAHAGARGSACGRMWVRAGAVSERL